MIGDRVEQRRVMAICSHCGGEMTEGISCLTDPLIINGRAYAPIPWGQELRPRHRYEPEECRDCGTPLGGIHHPGCCMERCPACQLPAATVAPPSSRPITAASAA